MFYWLEIIIYGIIQGLTEFLPVSSSGHLVLYQYFSKNVGEDLSLSVAVHLGTLCTVIYFYRERIAEILKGVAKLEPGAINTLSLIHI